MVQLISGVKQKFVLKGWMVTFNWHLGLFSLITVASITPRIVSSICLWVGPALVPKMFVFIDSAEVQQRPSDRSTRHYHPGPPKYLPEGGWRVTWQIILIGSWSFSFASTGPMITTQHDPNSLIKTADPSHLLKQPSLVLVPRSFTIWEGWSLTSFILII